MHCTLRAEPSRKKKWLFFLIVHGNFFLSAADQDQQTYLHTKWARDFGRERLMRCLAFPPTFKSPKRCISTFNCLCAKKKNSGVCLQSILSILQKIQTSIDTLGWCIRSIRLLLLFPNRICRALAFNLSSQNFFAQEIAALEKKEPLL